MYVLFTVFIVFLLATDISMSEYYYIVSQLNGLLLDVENSGTCPGTKVSPWPKNETDAQLWIDDPATGTIRNRIANNCLDFKGGVLMTNPYNGSPTQRWERHGNFIVSYTDRTKVLDIAEGNKSARAKVICYPKHGGPNQKWNFELSGVKK